MKGGRKGNHDENGEKRRHHRRQTKISQRKDGIDGFFLEKNHFYYTKE